MFQKFSSEHKGGRRNDKCLRADRPFIMVETALYLHRALGALVMPIVLTGAMSPLGIEGSDGLQNLTESLLAV